jgi:hypothetical protein
MGEEMRRLIVDLPASDHLALRHLAIDEDKSLADVIRELVRERLATYERSRPPRKRQRQVRIEE